MPASLVAAALIVVAIVLAFAVTVAVVYRRYRGKRLITCPENHEPAAVTVDALHAAAAAVRFGGPELRLSACSRWPERAGCDQACLSEIANAPEDCLVRNLVAQWYAGKECAICARRIGPVVWHEQPPAIMAPDGTTRDWTEARAEDLPGIFKSHQPVCFTCHLGEAFRREHSEWVIERARPAAPPDELRPTSAVY